MKSLLKIAGLVRAGHMEHELAGRLAEVPQEGEYQCKASVGQQERTAAWNASLRWNLSRACDCNEGETVPKALLRPGQSWVGSCFTNTGKYQKGLRLGGRGEERGKQEGDLTWSVLSWRGLGRDLQTEEFLAVGSQS